MSDVCLNTHIWWNWDWWIYAGTWNGAKICYNTIYITSCWVINNFLFVCKGVQHKLTVLLFLYFLYENVLSVHWQSPLLKYSKVCCSCAMLLWCCCIYDCICRIRIGDCILDIYWMIITKDNNKANTHWISNLVLRFDSEKLA